MGWTGELVSTRGPRRSRLDDRPLAGARLLIVEDEVIIAMELQSALEDAGAEVIGTAHTLNASMQCAACKKISAAILDLRLGPDSVSPVAHLLSERGIPFLFYSGQSENDSLRQEWPAARFLSKPATGRELTAAVVKLLATRTQVAKPPN
jgi:DNA-binding response OmpR family regulator